MSSFNGRVTNVQISNSDSPELTFATEIADGKVTGVIGSEGKLSYKNSNGDQFSTHENIRKEFYSQYIGPEIEKGNLKNLVAARKERKSRFERVLNLESKIQSSSMLYKPRDVSPPFLSDVESNANNPTLNFANRWGAKYLNRFPDASTETAISYVNSQPETVTLATASGVKSNKRNYKS